MKRLAVCLAMILLAKPAVAAVRIIVVPEGTTQVAINYDTTGGEKVRAFALDVSVASGTITKISDFHRGESSADPNIQRGYGIFPGSFGRYITVDSATGEVTDWNASAYSPVADPCDPGALGGLNTNGITIELGALYSPAGDDSVNAPLNSGTLCKLTLSTPTSVTVALNQIRGGIVLTNPSVAPTVDLTCATNVSTAAPATTTATTPSTVAKSVSKMSTSAETSSEYAEWVSVGKPVCWTYPRQCRGDADGRTEATPDGGTSYVGQADLNVLVAAWQILEPPFGPGIASVQNGICADFAHDKGGSAATGYYRVGTTDLNRLVANWLIKEAPAGPGIPADCGNSLK
jgi:hypothetical protein